MRMPHTFTTPVVQALAVVEAGLHDRLGGRRLREREVPRYIVQSAGPAEKLNGHKRAGSTVTWGEVRMKYSGTSPRCPARRRS